ncbi:Sec-independent protein translocase protein TatB [Orbus wheelerorum]
MFDLSLGKLILVLIIALVVLGPARLPKAIKTVASWVKALRRLSATVQLELNKELRLQELQDSLKQAEKSGLDNITPEIKASIDELKRVAKSIQKDFYDTADQVKSSVNDVTHSVEQLDPSKRNVTNQAGAIGQSSVSIGKDDNVR